jgi:hypothetical protein
LGAAVGRARARLYRPDDYSTGAATKSGTARDLRSTNRYVVTCRRSTELSEFKRHCWRSRRAMSGLRYEKPKVDYDSGSSSYESSSTLREAAVAKPMIVVAEQAQLPERSHA